MAKIKQLLLDFGLSQKQADVFLCIVKQGKSTAKGISDRSGITRTHVYDLVEPLVDLGLIIKTQKDGVKHFHAVDHDGLLSVISHKHSELGELKEAFVETASEFHKLSAGKKKHKTNVRFFDGIDGVYRIYYESRNDLAKNPTGKELLTVFSPDKLQKTIPGWFEKTQIMDDDLDISKRGILFPSFMHDLYVETMTHRNKNHKYKSWPKELEEFPTDTLCWLNKIAYVDLGEHPSGVVIENSAVVSTFKNWFNHMWNTLS